MFSSWSTSTPSRSFALTASTQRVITSRIAVSSVVGIEFEFSRTTRLGGAECIHGGGFDPVDVPRRWPRRRRAVFGCQRVPVDRCRPAVLVESRGHGVQFVGVFNTFGGALDDE